MLKNYLTEAGKKNDANISKFGHFMRKTRIDELSQLFNVLIGSMSLVGLRPERQAFYKMHKQALPEFR